MRIRVPSLATPVNASDGIHEMVVMVRSILMRR